LLLLQSALQLTINFGGVFGGSRGVAYRDRHCEGWPSTCCGFQGCNLNKQHSLLAKSVGKVQKEN